MENNGNIFLFKLPINNNNFSLKYFRQFNIEYFYSVLYKTDIKISANFIHSFFKFYSCSQIDKFIVLFTSHDKILIMTAFYLLFLIKCFFE
jgi:hypothetical protein